MKFFFVKIFNILQYIFSMIENIKVITMTTTMSDCSGKCIIVLRIPKFMNQNAADQ